MSEQLYFTINAGRAKRGTPVLDSQPGAHTGATRKYIPGYSDSNIVFLNTSTGNDGNTGASIAQALLTYSAAATAAGSTKKIRLVNSATLSTNITKPTEATIGTTSTIASSLTAPLTSLTAAATPGWTGGAPARVTWWPRLSKWFAVGNTEIVSSSDGNTWTLEETLSGFSGQRIFYSQVHDRLYVFGSAGKLLYSADGSTYTTIQFESQTLGAMAYSESLGVYVLGGVNNIYWSEDGLEWQGVPITWSNGSAGAIFAFDKFFVFNSDGYIATSTTGKAWTVSNPINGGYEVRAIAYMENVELLVVADVDGAIYSSPDGTTWTNRQAGSGSPAYDMTYIKETGYSVLCGPGRTLTYSVNGTAWTTTAALTAYGASDDIFGVNYSPLIGRLMTVGGSGSTRVNAFGPLYASTISASVAGFTIQAMQYSGTVTAYNCTLRQPGTTAALSFDSCRIIESGSHISNNARSSSGTLYEGDRHTTGAPASQDAISMTRDTVAGVWYIYNSSATGYEEIKDNIIEGGIVSTYAVTVTSGNTRGTSSGAVFSDECTQSDPKFVDETDYKLQREMDSYQYDSPMVQASQFYFNANGEARDLGAWSYNESTMEMLYTRHFPFLLPTGKDSFSNVLHSRVNRHVGEDGTPDVINDIDALWEEITLRYQTLPTDHIDFLDWWQGNFSDMTCEIDFFVGQPVSSTITVNGAHSAGDVTLTIDAGTTLAAGDRIFSGTEVYSVLYMVDDTLAVLSRKLAAGISDNAVLTISQPTGKGTYQYLPQADRDLRKPMGQAASEFDRGLVLNFSRKRV